MSPARRVTIEYPEYPLTLRNLRIGVAGRLGGFLTQAELAKKVGVTRSHIANVERGFMPASPKLLERIARLYAKDDPNVDLRMVRAAYLASRDKVDPEPRRSKAKKTK